MNMRKCLTFSFALHILGLLFFMSYPEPELAEAKMKPIKFKVLAATHMDAEVAAPPKQQTPPEPPKATPVKKIVQKTERIIQKKEVKRQQTPAPKVVSNVISAKERASYQALIVSKLERVKRYPRQALRRHLEDQVTLSLTIKSDGTVVKSKLIEESDFSFFNQEVKAMLQRALPFPKFPDANKISELKLTVPISFQFR